MNKVLLGESVMLFSVIISSLAQVLLKKSAGKQFNSKLKEYLNPMVGFSYLIFFGATISNILALKYVPLSLAPVIESTGYIFVSLFSYTILKERIGKRKVIGMAIIILGVLIFSF